MDTVDKVKQAEQYTGSKKYDLAVAAYQEAISQYRQEEDLAGWLKTQRAMVKLVGDTMGQMIKGMDYLKQEVFPKMLRAPATKEEYEQHCLLLIRKAEYEKRIRDFNAVTEDLQLPLSYLDGPLANGFDDIAEYIFAELGNAYVRLGEFEGAKNVFQRSLEYAKAHKAPDAAAFVDYASFYLTGYKEYAKAQEIAETGIRFEGISDIDKVLCYLNKAECLAHLDRCQEALVVNEQAARLIAQIDTSDDRFKRCRYGFFENYGIIHLKLAVAGDTTQFAKARNGYYNAIEIARTDDDTDRDVAGFYIGMAEVFEQQKNFAEACKFYHEVIRILIPDFQGGIQQHPDIELLYAEKLLIWALEGKARCFLPLGQAEKALECHELIPVISAKLIATHAYESSSLKTLEEARMRFDKAIAIAWELYQKTAEQRFAERAFALTEQARAVLLLQSISKARRDFRLPPEIRRQEQELDAKMAWLEQKIAAKQDTTDADVAKKVEQFKQELFQVKRTQQQFRTRLRSDYADYASLSDQLQFMNAAGVAGLLHKGQAMIDYYLTDSDIYIFYFKKNGAFTARKETLPVLFRENVLRYFTFMTSNNEKAEDKEWYLHMSFELYKLLLQPELEKDKNAPESLLIVPDDALAFIPFEVLLCEPATADTAWRDMKYLLHKLNTGYVYSATLWDIQQKISQDHRSKPPPKYNFAGFAPSYSSNAQQATTRSVEIPDSLIYDIKSTQQELDSVNALMGGKDYRHAAANEQAFKEIAPDCGILLLAMHGLANDEHPELSCLLFGKPKGDSINNDVLFANELQIMRLQADLAVLSACHTGFGKLHKGEGVYSLARAFAVAGVPSTVMSIWRLHETTAPLLIAAFFRHLKDGAPKDLALSMAKREFLKNDKNYEITHPFYWAGVTVSGDMCSLEPSSSLWWWIGGGVMLLALVLFLRKGRGVKKG